MYVQFLTLIVVYETYKSYALKKDFEVLLTFIELWMSNEAAVIIIFRVLKN